MSETLLPNQGRSEVVEYDGKRYSRLPIKTHIVTQNDTMKDLVKTYALPHIQSGDILFISEKIVACTQGRAIPLSSVKVSKLAQRLSKYVSQEYSEGLGNVESMQMAIEEAGRLRIILSAAFGGFGKLLGQKGWFYLLAGERVRGIDGPAMRSIPPYDESIVLIPLNTHQVCRELSAVLGGAVVAIVDANHIGCNLLGISHKEYKKEFFSAVLKDNPLGQSREQTPLGIIREKNKA